MCDCIKAINERLAISNTKIAHGFSFGEGKMVHHPVMIVTETTTPGKRRIKPPIVLASCCPFCGERYPENV